MQDEAVCQISNFRIMEWHRNIQRFEVLKLLIPQQLTVVANVPLHLALGKFVISKADTRRIRRNGLIKRQF